LRRPCLLLLGVMLGVVLSGCRDSVDRRGIVMNNERLADLAGKMRLTFPPGMRVLGVRETVGFDNAVFLKIEFGNEQWDRFLAASPMRDEEFSDERRYLLGANEDWWDPGRPQELPTAQTYLPQGKVLNMGIDRGDPAKAVVYLMWHET
jgi:hypothetical protein